MAGALCDDLVECLFSIHSYLQSIFSNLLSNALKYREPQRPLQVKLSLKQQADQLTLEVVDNGQGLDLERYGQRVFGFYQRFHQQSAGRGLGLHLVKTQVEMLGGEISLSSQPGQGTCFQICLPQNHSHNQPQSVSVPKTGALPLPEAQAHKLPTSASEPPSV